MINDVWDILYEVIKIGHNQEQSRIFVNGRPRIECHCANARSLVRLGNAGALLKRHDDTPQFRRQPLTA
jgi:hypothetical protein